jgi:glycosyltransferase involved in cell wall biosynthesis
MRIVLFDFFFEPAKPGVTGLGDLVWNWGGQLTSLGDEVHIVAPYLAGVQPPKGTIVHRFEVPPAGYRNVLGHVLIALRGWIEIRKLRQVDIIHAPEYLSTGVFSLLASRAPVVLTTPGNIFERIDNINHADWFTTQVYKLAARVSARRCAAIIATSAEMKRWWLFSGARDRQITQIPLGVDVEVFRPMPDAATSVGFGKRPSILFVGRLQAENGAEYLVRALKSVVRSIPDAVLHIVGGGPDLDMLRGMVQELELVSHVQWHGRVPLHRLPAFYSAADVFVLPRLSRVTPRVLFEAMACQAAVVTSAIGGIEDFVADGHTGFLVEPRNPAAIADRIVQVLQDRMLAGRTGEAAREYACQELSWPVVVRRMRDEVYVPITIQRLSGR